MLTDTERLIAARDALLFAIGGPPLRGEAALSDAQPAGQAPAPKIPVTVLSGFLGAGKTTLLCQLLEQATTPVVAIVNDVGAVNIDASLVRQRDGQTLELHNGCACCVLGSDLAQILDDVNQRSPRPGVVVIEASGVADPMGIAQTVVHNPGMALDGIVTLVDATTVERYSSDPAVTDVFLRQLAAAHLVVLTKTEHLRDPAAVRAALGEKVPGRPVLIAGESLQAGMAWSVLIGAATLGARLPVASRTHDVSAFAVATLTGTNAVPAGLFYDLLEHLPDIVYRLKGWLLLRDCAPPGATPADDAADDALHPVVVQAAGPRWRVDPHSRTGPGELVVIGQDCNRFTDFVERLQALGDFDVRTSAGLRLGVDAGAVLASQSTAPS